MTIPELVGVITSSTEVALAAMALYLSVLSGYLVVAYLVGKKLSRTQLTIISGLFTVFATILILGVYIFINTAVVSISENTENLEVTTGVYGFYIAPALCLIMVVGVFAALKFMLDVRKNP